LKKKLVIVKFTEVEDNKSCSSYKKKCNIKLVFPAVESKRVKINIAVEKKLVFKNKCFSIGLRH